MNKILEKYYNEGWLIKQVHPTKDLTIWNYSRATTWEDHWDSITLSCRGLVTNGVFFAIYDKKDLTKAIWLKLYPPFEKPFNANDDENNYDK